MFKISKERKEERQILKENDRISRIQSSEVRKVNKSKCPSEDASIISVVVGSGEREEPVWERGQEGERET